MEIDSKIHPKTNSRILIAIKTIHRTLGLKDMPEILLDTVKTTSMIFAIMIGATLFGFVLTILQVPQALTSLVAEMETSRWIVFIGKVIKIMEIDSKIHPLFL